ncbi:MAG: 3-hydroxybutyrate dehydrogenase [Lentisphaeria bacterium]|nr:3-hydroxybutyrate dehydrogenase [Lentisphaeria bacterium]
MKKVAIVTGGASGIGKSIAEALSQEGLDVIVADMQEEAGLVVAEAISGVFIKTDLSKRDSCRQLVDQVIRDFGRIDILINNAGFQHVSPIGDFSEDKWDQMLAVMLTAPFLLTKYVWPCMTKQKWGRIINMASIHGLVASPNKAAYVSAKHGLIGLTKAAALEGGEHGITVNALCPSYVRTPLVENQIADLAKENKVDENEVLENVLLKSAAIKNLIEPKEISSLVLFLCSDNGASITGASWTIDCGWTAQ